MIKEISLEVTFLVQGLFPIDEEYEIDEFKLQIKKVDIEITDSILQNGLFYTPFTLLYSTYQEEGSLDKSFSVLTNKNYIFKLNNKFDDLSKEEITKEIQKDLHSISSNLEKRLKLITNMDIVLSIGTAKTYNIEGIDNISIGTIYRRVSNLNVSVYTEEQKNIIAHRLKQNINIYNLDELENKNSRFKRSLSLYYDSFVPDDVSIRFVLLFSSLEALFNLTGQRVKENIASSTSKILFDEKKEITYRKIRNYYNKRSSYIHGNEPEEISDNHEFDLREIVRKVLLIYLYIYLEEKIEKPKEIISFINKGNMENISLNLY